MWPGIRHSSSRGWIEVDKFLHREYSHVYIHEELDPLLRITPWCFVSYIVHCSKRHSGSCGLIGISGKSKFRFKKDIRPESGRDHMGRLPEGKDPIALPFSLEDIPSSLPSDSPLSSSWDANTGYNKVAVHRG